MQNYGKNFAQKLIFKLMSNSKLSSILFRISPKFTNGEPDKKGPTLRVFNPWLRSKFNLDNILINKQTIIKKFYIMKTKMR